MQLLTKKLRKYTPLTYELKGLDGCNYGDLTRTFESKCAEVEASCTHDTSENRNLCNENCYCPDRIYFRLFLNQDDIDKGRILDQGRNVLDLSRTGPSPRNGYIEHGVASYWEADDDTLQDRLGLPTSTKGYRWATKTSSNSNRYSGYKQHKTRQDAEAYLDTWVKRRFKRLNN